MKNPNSTRNYILITIAILAALFGLWAYHNITPKTQLPQLASATVFPQSRSIDPFQLTSDTHKPFTLDTLKGHWNLVFFGFTNCPDLCPTTLAILNKAYKKLQDANAAALPQIVFISVDPERDTPDQLNGYLHSFNPHFIGATGDKTQIDKLTQELSVLYQKVAEPLPGHPDNYTIDHSGTILIVDPNGHFRGVFTLPHDSDKIAHDTQVIMTHG